MEDGQMGGVLSYDATINWTWDGGSAGTERVPRDVVGGKNGWERIFDERINKSGFVC